MKKLTCLKSFVATAGIALVASLVGLRASAQATDTKDNKESPIKFEKTEGGERATYGSGPVKVYAEGGGRPKSHDEPKGEVHGFVGVKIEFGGSSAKNGESGGSSGSGKSSGSGGSSGGGNSGGSSGSSGGGKTGGSGGGSGSGKSGNSNGSPKGGQTGK